MSGLRLAIFASGAGTLFESIATACRTGKLTSQPALLLSSTARAGVMERAARLGVPAHVLRRDAFADDAEFSAAMLSLLRDHDANFICLAGYLKLVPAAVVRAFQQRIINIHPALLPAFGGPGMYGRRVHEAVLEYGARVSGATVHIVDEQYDHGPIVLQQAVTVEPQDTPDSLAARVHAIEHDLYIAALRLFETNRITIKGRLVTISGD